MQNESLSLEPKLQMFLFQKLSMCSRSRILGINKAQAAENSWRGWRYFRCQNQDAFTRWKNDAKHSQTPPFFESEICLGSAPMHRRWSGTHPGGESPATSPDLGWRMAIECQQTTLRQVIHSKAPPQRPAMRECVTEGCDQCRCLVQRYFLSALEEQGYFEKCLRAGQLITN